MGSYKSMLTEVKNGIGYVYFNNPENNNRIGTAEGEEMIAALEEIDKNSEAKIVILSGKGEYFCSGGKVAGFPDGKVVDTRYFQDVIMATVKAIHNMHKPIIAAVSTNALAGGFMYMDACDLAVVGEDSKFGLPEIQRGFFPMVALVALQRSIPKKRLFEMAYTGDLVDAKTVYNWNLVNYIVPNDKVMEKAEEIALRLKEYNPMSLNLGRDCYYSCLNMSIDDAMRYANVAMVNMVNTHDAKETAYAAAEERKPKYLGY